MKVNLIGSTSYVKKFFFITKLLLVFLSVSLLFSCSDEMYKGALPSKHQKDGITFSQFKEITGMHDFKTTMKIPKSGNEEVHNQIHDIQARAADGSYEFSDFIIDTTFIRRNIREDKTTYTFWITPRVVEKRSMFNLMVYNDGGKWDMSIIEFVPSQDFLDKYEAEISTQLEGEIRHVYSSSESFSSRRVSVWITRYHCNRQGNCADGPCDMCNLCVSNDVVHIGNPGPNYTVIQIIDQPGGSNSGGGGGGNISNPYTYPFGENFPNPNSPGYLKWHMSTQLWNQINNVQRQWINSNPVNTEFYLDLLDAHTAAKGISAETVINAIDYAMEHPGTTWEQYKNWFLPNTSVSDGVEDFDAAFWNNPNLTFPTQQLPSLDDFLLAFPSRDLQYSDPSLLYNAIGKDVLSIYNANPSKNSNTCAARVSWGLNYSGIEIPHIPNITFEGSDGKYYFMGAQNLIAWMKKTFGVPTGTNRLTGAEGGINGVNFPDKLKDKQGIYGMIPNYPAKFKASGHIDFYIFNDCDGKCYFAPDGGVFEIYFWELN